MTLDQRRQRRHLARAERERRLRRNILIGVAAAGLLVVGVLGYGLYETDIRRPSLPVVTVNGDELSQDLYRARVILAQAEASDRYQNTRSLMSLLADSPEALASIQQELSNLEAQLADPSLIGQQVLEQLIQDLLVRQEAIRRGIEVSEAEVDQAVQELFGYYAEGTRTPLPSQTPLSTGEAGAVATATVTVTPTAGPSPTPRPTSTPYTLDLFEENYERYLQELLLSEISEEHFRYFVESEVYRRELRQAIAADVPRVQEQVQARHILVEEEATARDLLERLGEGADWVELAAEYSTDSSNRDRGGELGWFGLGRMVEAFEQAAFEGEVGEVVGPVETPFGFHLIDILAHENRELGAAAYDAAVNAAFNEWLQEARGNADLNVLETWPDLLPTADPVRSTGGF